MLMALETGAVDFVCTDMPTGQGALVAYDDLVLLDFAGSGDDFTVSDEDVNIGISPCARATRSLRTPWTAFCPA